MNLRRKLVVTFGGLGFMTLLVALVTAWAMVQWSSTEAELREHYTRSILLENVRAQTSQAMLEIPEGLTGNDPDARQDFQETIQPAEEDFRRWSDLADTDAEREEVETVRGAYDEAVSGAQRAFDLIEEENLNEAETLFDDLEDNEIEQFQTVAEEAAAADQERREVIRDGTEGARRTAQIMLAVASFGALSLVMLLAAYLASDLFSPLKDVRQALASVRRGDRRARLTEERSDEVGDINREFNRMVEAISLRERRGGNGSGPSESHPEENGDDSGWLEMPVRVTLHQLISQMRRDVESLENGGENGSGRGRLANRLDELSRAVERINDFAYPLDLNLERTDVRAMVYGVVARFQGEFVERSVSLEVDISPEVRRAVVDRLRLRESLSELVRNALDALPERGGKIGIRVRVSGESAEPELLIEVADDGVGAEQSLIDDAFERRDEEYSGLKLIRGVIEQHGGEFAVDSEPGEGTYAQIRLPIRD
jgi:two-component system, OmpR family, sensor kinase